MQRNNEIFLSSPPQKAWMGGDLRFMRQSQQGDKVKKITIMFFTKPLLATSIRQEIILGSYRLEDIPS